MKSTRTAITALRAARATQSIPSTSIRLSSTEAGPSSQSATPSQSPSSRRLPRPVLRGLVELHHHSATFLQDPTTMSEGFKTTFHTLHTPILTSYNVFNSRARKLHARRSLGGLDNLRIKHPKGTGAAFAEHDDPPASVKLSRSAFTGEDSWMEGSSGMLSERELRVQEALYGSLERGSRSRSIRGEIQGVDVGLEGVEEFMEARGKQIGEDAKMWEGRHDEA